jgi:hypothetical protein
VSGFSPVTLSFLGLVLVVTLCLSILAVRRDHPDHVHTLWHNVSVALKASQGIDLGRELVTTSKAQSERRGLTADRQQHVNSKSTSFQLRSCSDSHF